MVDLLVKFILLYRSFRTIFYIPLSFFFLNSMSVVSFCLHQWTRYLRSTKLLFKTNVTFMTCSGYLFRLLLRVIAFAVFNFFLNLIDNN